MNHIRLEEIGTAMFPEGDWKGLLAKQLGIDRTTVWRWMDRKEVPPAVAAGLECIAKEKVRK